MAAKRFDMEAMWIRARSQSQAGPAHLLGLTAPVRGHPGEERMLRLGAGQVVQGRAQHVGDVVQRPVLGGFP